MHFIRLDYWLDKFILMIPSMPGSRTRKFSTFLIKSSGIGHKGHLDWLKIKSTSETLMKLSRRFTTVWWYIKKLWRRMYKKQCCKQLSLVFGHFLMKNNLASINNKWLKGRRSIIYLCRCRSFIEKREEQKMAIQNLITTVPTKRKLSLEPKLKTRMKMGIKLRKTWLDLWLKDREIQS